MSYSGSMSGAEVMQKLSEYFYYKNSFPNFSVLLHSYVIERKVKKSMTESIQKELFDKIPEEELSFLLAFSEYLDISENNSEKEKFLNFCKTPISPSEKTELKNRISEIDFNPEIGVSSIEVIRGIEKIIGEPISFSSKS